MLNEENPDTITVGKVNYPMWIGYGDDEMFIASAAMVFDRSRIRQKQSLPTCSVIEVKKDSVTIHPFTKPFVKVYDENVREKEFKAIVDGLREGPKTFYPLGATLAGVEGILSKDEVYSLGMIPPKGVVYEVLDILQARGCIKIDKEIWPGAGSRPDLTRETFVVSLIKEP